MLALTMCRRKCIHVIFLEEISGMKLCQIYNFASHYRAPIFTLISREFDSDFVFGNPMCDIKKMDYSLLRGNVVEVDYKTWHGFSFQKGILPLLRKKYDNYILTGGTRCISTWLFLLFAKFYPRKMVYLWTHGWYGKESKMERLMKKFFFSLPDGIFLYGNYAKQLMVNEGFKEDKLFVIHNSLNYDAHVALRDQMSISPIYKNRFNNDAPNLMFVGRLTPVKKLEMVLEAMALNRKQGKNYNLTLIGNGEQREALERFAHELNLQDNVWFYGSCYDEKVLSELIYNADLCVSPGNVGLTAIHSLVFGTPVLTHNNFSLQMPEFEAVREGETGSFFEYDNVESLSKKLKEWFSSGRDREEVRCACMKEIDESWNPYFQLEILKKVLN